MLRWITLAVVVVALVGAATFMSLNTTIADSRALLPPPPPTGPSAKFVLVEPATFEFGTMSQLSSGKHTWEIKNAGAADLALTLGGTTCSCTVAKLDGVEKPTLVVKPSESTKIDVEWQTKVFHDDYSQGVTLKTNDPSRPSVSIKVHGMVYPPVVVVPTEQISYGTVSNEEAQSAKVAVFSRDRPGTRLTKLTTSRPDFLVANSQSLPAEDCKALNVQAGYRVTVEMKPGMPPGRFLEELVIETDHPGKSEIKLTITGNTTGPITVIPDRLWMSSVSSSTGATRDMTLLVRERRPTKFEVAHHPEKLDVKITPDDTPTQKGRYKLTVTVPRGTSAGHVIGEIILKTDHPRSAQMKIPVTVLIFGLGAD
jgi:hypothetical protein